MIGLITDRNQGNVDRRNALAKKGWHNMTSSEQAEWSGDPLLSEGGANLLPNSENYADGVSVRYQDDSVYVESVWDGAYIYAILPIGPAANFENKTMTLSLGSYYSTGGNPQAALYWHDADGYEFAGAALTDAGSVTFTTSENTGARENLALYLYATTDADIVAGDYIRYEQLMLEFGDTQHDYVPYYEVVPTAATKGAYNYSDLNRVESAVAYLAKMLGLSLTTKTDWTHWDIPNQSDLERFLSNLRMIRTVGVGLPTTPQVPVSMQKFNYTMANDIEQILLDVDAVLTTGIRSGDVYSGEV